MSKLEDAEADVTDRASRSYEVNDRCSIRTWEFVCRHIGAEALVNVGYGLPA